MRIRHAEAGRDAAACAEIYAPFVRDTPISFEEQPPDAAELAHRITEVSGSYPWLVAEDEGQVVGYAYAGPHRQRAAYRWAADVAVYVAPDQRRRGVGRALYEALLALLARQGIRVACAGITLPNEASVRLHEALGFQPVGVYRRIGWKAGAWHDVGWWQLELLAPDSGRAPDSGPPADPGPPARLDED
ncbi:MAG: arsinothricin resistance N-acetyltransferase ArsN1 family B [Solirubrobacteraceae bacterium]